MSDCDRTPLHEWIPDFVHGTLDAAQRAEVEAHLATCAEARAELALVREARDAIVRRTPVVDPAAVVAAVRASRGARVRARFEVRVDLRASRGVERPVHVVRDPLVQLDPIAVTHSRTP